MTGVQTCALPICQIYTSSFPGTGIYLAKDEAKPMPELLWGIEIIKLIREKFKILEDKDDHNMAIRLVDCYGLFDYLIGSMEGK